MASVFIRHLLEDHFKQAPVVSRYGRYAMARAGRKDRGLLSEPDSTGKLVWYLRLNHEGRERRFGSFPTKTKAREFYEKAKLE